MPRSLTLDNLLDARDSVLWLEEVDMGEVHHNPVLLDPVHFGHNTLLDRRDATTYTVEVVNGKSRLVKGETLTLPKGCCKSTVCVDSRIFCLFGPARGEPLNTPSRVHIYELDSGVWSECDVSPILRIILGGDALTMMLFCGMVLFSSEEGLCFLDPDSMEVTKASDRFGLFNVQYDVIHPIPVGDTVVLTLVTREGHDQYPSYSRVNGWEKCFQSTMPEEFDCVTYIPVANSTLCVGYSLDEEQDRIGYLDAVSGEFVFCCLTGFVFSDLVRLSSDRYLVQCSSDPERLGGWYILNLDLCLLQERGGGLTPDMFVTSHV
ncbi:hypothetical protein KIPB_010827 [Kipferlia bialata]|uniref:Uncharacterized protein n=1 Tax=Kipferlia bialata TaxID=797122 RepID=A0A9K3D5N2_9EUKA|nr:hypothetical protein KIPB_010827 [Kipferlia bialata]|eukprot:g10827.t1